MPPPGPRPDITAALYPLFAAGVGTAEAVRRTGFGRTTVVTYKGHWRAGGGKADAAPAPAAPKASPARLPDPAPEAGGPRLPEPVNCDYKAFSLDEAGAVGILSDPHVPYHDLPTIRGWVDDCRRHDVKALLLNGDVLDFYQLSDYLRDPSKPRMREEILKGKQFLEYLRSTFPKARIVYKEGNHDERLKRYLANRAPDLLDLEEIRLPRLLEADRLGVEWVEDKRIVLVGKLPVIHGHEYRGGGGVMPARWLYLRTGESAMMGHLHQPTFYSFRTMTGKEVGMWSLGCACHLSPLYAPLNQWAHGWGVVEVARDGGFNVHQRRLLRDGRVA
jgi:predicted phosphodiesterase